MEGYFPSELQERFPDGVPLKVSLQSASELTVALPLLLPPFSSFSLPPLLFYSPPLPQLTDCRDVVFRERQYADIFPGAGRQQGGQQGPSRLLPSTAALWHHEKETSELPG